jgi:formylglycine-generating enzyme required for sulfatase activity
MISRPAARAGLEYEEGLAGHILKDTGADPGVLALMAYLLDELYRHCEKTGSKRLSHAAYESLGGVQGAIGTRAQTVFDALDDTTKAALPGVFQNLVEVDERGTATRQRAMLNKITGGENENAAAKLVEALTDARLLVQSKGEGDWPVVEVAHEALLRSWPKLTQWITEAQEDLILLRQVKTAAEQWEHSERHKAFLWPHERLVLVYAMIARLKPDLDEATRDFIKPEIERLVDETRNPATDHRRRASIGDRLAEIGDTRPGVGLRPDGIPDMVWCEVPGGSVTLEKVKGTFEVQAFKIAKYPVTYIQYRVFVEAADGYQDERWWEGLQHKAAPGQQNRPTNNHPAEKVSWYDAIAFCRWLTAKYEAVGLLPLPLGAGTTQRSSGVRAVIRLPTEQEWQQAATNGDPSNEYPWGTWDGSKVNTSESGLSRTTAVGIYPQGAAGNGALDISGNVWEWCLNEYGDPERIGIDGTNDRVVRGGSWFNSVGFARAASRLVRDPRHRYDGLSFRVCASAPS